MQQNGTRVVFLCLAFFVGGFFTNTLWHSIEKEAVAAEEFRVLPTQPLLGKEVIKDAYDDGHGTVLIKVGHISLADHDKRLEYLVAAYEELTRKFPKREFGPLNPFPRWYEVNGKGFEVVDGAFVQYKKLKSR